MKQKYFRGTEYFLLLINSELFNTTLFLYFTESTHCSSLLQFIDDESQYMYVGELEYELYSTSVFRKVRTAVTLVQYCSNIRQFAQNRLTRANYMQIRRSNDANRMDVEYDKITIFLVF